jgi:hypothetical protein
MSRYTDFLVRRYGENAEARKAQQRGDLADVVQRAFRRSNRHEREEGEAPETAATAAATEYLMNKAARTPGGRPAGFTTDRDAAYCTCGVLKKQHGAPGHHCTKQYPKE